MLDPVFQVFMMLVATVFANTPAMKKEAFANILNIKNQTQIIFATVIARSLFCINNN